MPAHRTGDAKRICKAQKRAEQGSEKRMRYRPLGSEEVGGFSRSYGIVRYRPSHLDLISTYELHNC